MFSMADIITWSGLRGNWQYAKSMAGASFYSLGGTDGAAMTIAEFGSIPVSDLEQGISVEEWMYSQFDEDPGSSDFKSNIQPKALHKNMARKAHRAAGIWAGLVKPMGVVQAENAEA